MTGIATEATESALARIAKLDPRINAFATVAPAHAREQARHLDAMAEIGAPAGPLYGMVVGIKDIIDVAGLPTRGGSLTRAQVAPAAVDAPVVQRLRAAGAVVIGKTNTVEYAFGGWGTNVSVGTPMNPWDLTAPRAPGGSSNGSGAAVGAGLVPAALGTDTGGSVRLPAAFCGTVGLKTTAGLLPNTGVLPLSRRFDTVGPLTRTVADCARVFAALAGDDSRLIGGEQVGALSGDIAGLRVGVLSAPDVPLHPDTARVFAETQRTLETLGAIVRPAGLPRPITAYVAAIGAMASVHGYGEYAALAEADPCLLGAPVRGRMLGGRDVTAAWLLAELDRQARDIAAMVGLFNEFDALLTPTTATPAPLLSDYDEDASPAIFTRFVNYLDLSAISVPMGLSGERLPIGMQIVVPGFHELRALNFAAALEAARAPLLLELD
jgi:aspartyl-tRNA(Asn)/glutamyl-tRNA(Gln) amidotransferase subunit A